MSIARSSLLICVAAAVSAAALLASQPAAKRRPQAAAASDSEIEKAIRARFARSKIDADKFQVHVQGGVATIEGHTDVVQRKGTATRLAKTAGALQVVNKIEVSAAGRERASTSLAKGRRRAQIKRGEERSQATGR